MRKARYQASFFRSFFKALGQISADAIISRHFFHARRQLYVGLLR